jgi:hypothetical protein
MGRLDEVRGEILPVINELAYGYRVPGMVGTYLFPVRKVPKMKTKIPKFGKEHFKLFKTLRGLGAKSNRLPVDSKSTITLATEEHDAEYPIDYLEGQEAPDELSLRKHAAFRAKTAVALEMEAEIAEIAQNLDNYLTDNKKTLTLEDKWSDYENSDPEEDIETAKDVVADAIGEEINTMVIDRSTYKILRKHPVIKAELSDSERKVVTIDMLKEILEIPNIYVGRSYYIPDTGNADSSFVPLWQDCCILAYVPEPPADITIDSIEDVGIPAWGYTIQRQGYPMTFEYAEGAKLTLVNYTDNYQVNITGQGAAYILKGTGVAA